MLDEADLRQKVIDCACALHRDKLTVANSGNVSVRYGDGLLITPTGVVYEQLQPEDIVFLSLQGEVLSGELKPSSEWHFHCDLYLHKPEVEAIVHAHSPAATALSCLRQPVPAFHYMVALMGGNEIPCADYATFGTAELSASLLAALSGYKACLMANHGMTATGGSLEAAYRLAQELESLCDMYTRAKSLGSVVLLSPEQIAEAAAAFADYGQK